MALFLFMWTPSFLFVFYKVVCLTMAPFFSFRLNLAFLQSEATKRMQSSILSFRWTLCLVIEVFHLKTLSCRETGLISILITGTYTLNSGSVYFRVLHVKMWFRLRCCVPRTLGCENTAVWVDEYWICYPYNNNNWNPSWLNFWKSSTTRQYRTENLRNPLIDWLVDSILCCKFRESRSM